MARVVKYTEVQTQTQSMTKPWSSLHAVLYTGAFGKEYRREQTSTVEAAKCSALPCGTGDRSLMSVATR
eukprot:4723408-Amphidinium_carterae.2